MLELSGERRDTYSPSGKVNWLLFYPGFVLTVGVALVMAACLLLAFDSGLYLVLVAPAIAALVTGGAWYLVLKWCHCRNKFAAIVGSVLLGLIVYLGYFHLDIVRHVGLQNAHRVDLLPEYIRFRMLTDVVREANRPNRDPAGGAVQQPNTLQHVMNWLILVGELAAVIAIVMGLGVARASMVYCETCHRWGKRELLNIPAGLGAFIWELLCQGKFAEAQQRLTSMTGAIQVGCGLTIEHCTECQTRPDGSRVFLTVNDFPRPQVSVLGIPVKHKEQAQKLVSQVALHPKEVVALAAAFPSLKSCMESQPEIFAAAKLEVEAVKPEIPELGPQLADWPHQLAEIEVLQGPTARTILTSKTIAIQTLIGLVTLFGPWAVGGVSLGLVFQFVKDPPVWLTGVTIAWCMICVITGFVWMLYFPNYWTARFMRWRTWKSFAARPDSAVDWHNPDLFFVDIIPRANWGKVMLENASDIGFLELSHQHGELIFEGDRERYWIPADSIIEVKHESFQEVANQTQGTPILSHVIVVRAMTAKGPWETWFYRRHEGFKMRTAQRRLADAKEMESKIREFLRDALPPTAEH